MRQTDVKIAYVVGNKRSHQRQRASNHAKTKCNDRALTLYTYSRQVVFKITAICLAAAQAISAGHTATNAAELRIALQISYTTGPVYQCRCR